MTIFFYFWNMISLKKTEELHVFFCSYFWKTGKSSINWLILLIIGLYYWISKNKNKKIKFSTFPYNKYIKIYARF